MEVAISESLAQIYQKFILSANNSLNTIHIFLSTIKSSLLKVYQLVYFLYKQNYRKYTSIPVSQGIGGDII